MSKYHLKGAVPCVRYFYLPANSTRGAEIIQVINSSSTFVQVPMREEDVELSVFFERELIMNERLTYGSSETWKVFTSWDEVEQDHNQFGLTDEVLPVLLSMSYRFTLQEDIAVPA